MILTVTLNAALDVTYRLDRLRPHTSHRVHATASRAGGKGINVSRVLHSLGHRTVVTGMAGGSTGEAVRRDLAVAGLLDQLVPIAGETRRTVAVVDEHDGDTTMLLEPGPEVSAAEWSRFMDRFDQLLPGAAAAVLSGSLPVGVPTDAYAVLLRMAHAHHVPVVLDADGLALRTALADGPVLIKPNADELTAASGEEDPLTAAEALRAAGAEAVVASLGAGGLIAVTAQGVWRAYQPEKMHANPTGAGDAVVASLTLGLLAQAPWRVRLTEAVALSAAAAASPLAGDFDATVYRRLLAQVTVEPLILRQGILP